MNAFLRHEQRKKAYKLIIVIGAILLISTYILYFFNANKKQVQDKAWLISDSIDKRSKTIKGNFSVWDGSHKELRQMIIANIADEASFEAITTNYVDQDSFLIVNMLYRYKGEFGRIIRDSIKAKCTLDGAIIEIIN